ncbi:MAG: cysteine--tRNA ligase [Clostridia bacterium]|nr:cysteine--tRNA ligase [Clostridia bacterium]
MKIYNTLTKKVDEFVPNEAGKVKMYTCGPTVYHFAHIGNLRSYIMEDVLEKFLRFAGYDVTRVMNITDVGHLSSDGDTGEDKMLKGAKREKKTVLEIAEFYKNAFFEDCKKLNIKYPDIVEPATHCIGEFIKMIEGLMEKGYAYFSDGNVYFDTSKVENYNVLTGHLSEELMVGVRDDVTEDTSKRNKSDFVLWFTKSKFDDQELKWDSPWGVGYPGWHIECSSICMKHLGNKLDIHCGGVDNIFPHHTNEIAQSEAYTGEKWCNYWFHVHHLNDETGKMSKSKGDFLTVSLIESKGYNPLVYRFFCLQSHYRKPLVFSYPALDQAQATYQKLVKRIASLKNEGEADSSFVKEMKEAFINKVGNDLNTALGITCVYDILKAQASDKSKLEAICEIDKVLGVGLIESSLKLKAEENEVRKDESAPVLNIDPELKAKIEGLIQERAEAKRAKNFQRADEIRDRLKEMGVTIVDSRQGTTYTLD